ncbi:hypothetical protein SAMN05421663_10720 [Terribacillus halophilus]|uniref:Restriction endonuclease type I HsdR N-terminal domain-containing protein n=1 Tax=Terribacillus halophilus TaxID=361279 RepID=A0A1G6S935_9BACI|nr:type I restriction endonuclease [Terribacillus halophilus]SDD13243.1 hypothetical protein SAMN05421663_10720 [Terribacillus halophilus]
MEEFADKIKALSKRVSNIVDTIETEEATKTSIIMPFFQLLGYDVFNPNEFLPEFTADVGIKKGEKVDYAIMKDSLPLILIEAKPVTQDLGRHDSQLFRYFGTTSAKFAILTNGKEYKFYTDLDETNKMDQKPFFIFDLFDIKESKITELHKFAKSNFDVDDILNTASELRYTNEIKELLSKEIKSPSDEFIHFFLKDIYPGKKTRNVLDSFKGVVAKSVNQFINEKVNDKLQAALNNTSVQADAATKEEINISADIKEESGEQPIVTTEEEIEGYVHVKMVLNSVIEPERVFYRDNKSYFNILIDDNIRKWVCRLGLNGSNKWIQLNDDAKTIIKINHVQEINKHVEEIRAVADKFIH